LILNSGKLAGGTEYTCKIAEKTGKPYLVIQLDQPLEYSRLSEWISDNNIEVINVAGPREKPEDPIYDRALNYLQEWNRHER
jgi:hypothetical protein